MQTTKHLTLKERRKIQKRQRLYRLLCGVTIGLFALYLNIQIFGETTTNDVSEYYDIERSVSNEANLSTIKNAVDVGVVKLTTESYQGDSSNSCNETDLTTKTVIVEPTVSIKKTDSVKKSEEKESKKPKKKITSSHDGKEMYVPGYCGSVHPYMGWACITDTSSPQYKLKQACESYDDDGFGKVGKRYAVAMKPYYGDIGDYVDIIQNDGIEYHCIIVDHKGMENKSEDGWLATYAHFENDIVEFVVNKSSWYGTDKTVSQYHPEFSRNIKTIYNVGNYWE